MIAFFVNYSTVAFPLHLPTSHDCVLRQLLYRRFPPTFTNAKTTAILWRGANSLRKNSYFSLPLDVRRCVAPTGEEVDARQRGVN